MIECCLDFATRLSLPGGFRVVWRDGMGPNRVGGRAGGDILTFRSQKK
jgi:hypothetical protein